MDVTKKTDCPARLTIKVHNKHKDYPHPCEVNLTCHHNHSIHSAHAIIFKPISHETKEKFFQYFTPGHSPSSAKKLHELNLLTQFEGKNVEILHADRSVNPSAQDIYYLFRTWREE